MAAATTQTRADTEADLGEETPRPYRMTVEIYEKIVAAGVFGDTSPLFLWKGRLVLPMTKGPDHENALATLLALTMQMVPDGWHVRPGSPVSMRNDSEPEPDLVILRGAIRDYRKRTPRAIDVPLAIEISDSSLRYDSGEKRSTYAAASIPVYWIVNIPKTRIDVFTAPSGPTEAPSYAEHKEYGPDDDVPIVLDGREVGRIPVREVLLQAEPGV